MNLPNLKNELTCCGCGLCAEICPKQAINMVENTCGFIYPDIDSDKCIHCGLCTKRCSYHNNEGDIAKVRYDQNTYAGINLDETQKHLSTSAGIFAAIAKKVILLQGFVYGAAMSFDEGKVNIEHICIDDLKDLHKLQGSKYVQSNISTALSNIKDKLKSGRIVLFSGTPCQVAAIKELTGNPSNLLTIDLVCHGVPSKRFFQDYLNTFSKKHKETIYDFKFRDKNEGWGHEGKIFGKTEYVFSPSESSYYKLFLDCEILRDNCYQCPFACDKRVGDLTVGDYWGIQKYSPELLVENGGFIHAKEGASCILENTEKGAFWLEKCRDLIQKAPVDIDKIKRINTRLVHPATHTELRFKVMSAYKAKGYDGVEKLFIKILLPGKIKSRIKKCIPSCIRNNLKKIIKKN